MSFPPSLSCRVYYEDTDAGGVVYYANYLHFAERGRSEFLRHVMGRTEKLWQEDDPLFVVRHLDVDYTASAKLDDLLTVETFVTHLGGASLDMLQRINRDQKTLVVLKVTLVTVTPTGKVLRLPENWRQKLAPLVVANPPNQETKP